MLVEDRHNAILALVEARGSITVRELAEELGVAAVTIRVDVRELARRGLLTRVHGGARRAPRAELRAEAPDEAVDREYTVGVVVPHPSYYYPAVVAGARAAADRLGVRLLLGVSRNTVGEERAQVAQMLKSGVRGLVLTPVHDPRVSRETEEWLAGIPIPVVLAERRAGMDTGSVEHVATDHEHGAYAAVRHLMSLGRKRLQLVMLDTKTAPMLRAGYEAALDAFGLREGASEVPPVLAEDDAEAFEEVCGRLVASVRAGEVDAAIIHNDSLAIPMVSRLRAEGVVVPGELSVVAYDDELASMADPPLSAVAPPRESVGGEAVEMVVRRLEEPGRPPHHLLLRPSLHVRRSCGGPGSIG